MSQESSGSCNGVLTHSKLIMWAEHDSFTVSDLTRLPGTRIVAYCCRRVSNTMSYCWYVLLTFFPVDASVIEKVISPSFSCQSITICK